MDVNQNKPAASEQTDPPFKSTCAIKQKKIVENSMIIWLNCHFNLSSADHQEYLNQLRSIVNTVEIITTPQQCVEYCSQIKDERIFLITSEIFSNELADLENQCGQLNSIYVLCTGNTTSRHKMQTYKKGRGIFKHMTQLCNELEKEVRLLEKSTTSTSIIPDSSSVNPNELDPSFMYCQLLKENFLLINDRKEQLIEELVDYCQLFYGTDAEEKKRLDQFQKTYQLHMNNKESPIWWYTLNCFLYKMLNKALRTLDIEILMKLSFFIRDVHEQIKGRHKKLQTNEIPKLVYRGQVLSSEDLEKLQQNLGGLWSFNCFLSTSVKKDAAKSFAQWFRSPLLNGVLLEIQIDSSTSSVPFSPIRDISAFPNEEEILFSIGTVFRINQVYRIEDGLWKINLTLTDDRDSSLNQLTDHIRRSLGQGSGWRQMGQLMIKMQRFDKAREIYYELMKGVASDNHPDNAFIHNQLGFIEKQLGYLDRACSHYETSIRLKLEAMPPNDPRLSSTYSNIGVILKKLNKPDKALEYFQLVLEIDLAASAPNRLEIATDYNNIGSVFDGQGKLCRSLEELSKSIRHQTSSSAQNSSVTRRITTVTLVSLIEKWVIVRQHCHFIRRHWISKQKVYPLIILHLLSRITIWSPHGKISASTKKRLKMHKRRKGRPKTPWENNIPKQKNVQRFSMNLKENMDVHKCPSEWVRVWM